MIIQVKIVSVKIPLKKTNNLKLYSWWCGVGVFFGSFQYLHHIGENMRYHEERIAFSVY